MATTIQVSHELKQKIDKIKGEKTYEQIIAELLVTQKRMKVAEQMSKYNSQIDQETKDWLESKGPWD
jgi:predicted CopG family antitoxin